MASSFSTYIQSCTSDKKLKQLPEVKVAFNGIYEKMKADYATCCVDASAAEELVSLYKLDYRQGSALEMVEANALSKMAAVYMAKAMLDAVKTENDICDAFFTWVQWRYECAGDHKEKARAEISKGIFLSSGLKTSEETLNFWLGASAPAAYSDPEDSKFLDFLAQQSGKDVGDY